MTAVASVRVPERGATTIDKDTWTTLRGAPEFWQLVDGGILSVEQEGRDRVRLAGGAHVGRAWVAGVLVEVHEKVEGATAALMAAATPRLRIRHVPSPTSELGRLVALLVEGFVDEVREYAGRGRQWQYDEHEEVGSTVAGRLDVRRTLDLRARGQVHLAAFHRTTVSRVTPLNRIVLAALREIEVLASLQRLRPADVAHARALAVLFEDCLDASILGRSPDLAQEAADLVADSPSANANLLSLAALLLSHQSLQPEQPNTGTAPLAWFVNLETLFERVVIASARAAAPPGTTITKGAQYGAAVFPAQGLLVADPDLVIGGRPALAIGDVKYKTWERAAAASDLYQLLVHAATFRATDAFLVYPADGFDCVDLGTSSTGCRTRLYAVDVRDVPTEVRLLPGLSAASAAVL